MRWFLEELKRRNVLRAAAFYAAAAWLLVQIATQVFPFFDIPNWTVRLVVVAVIVGFPFALVISWFYELTPSGFKREIEPGQNPSGSIWRHRAFRMALLSAAGIGLALLIAAGMVSRRGDSRGAAGISIAVMPFRNLSASPDNAYFAEGIQDEILTRLSRIRALRVISRTSSARYASAPANLPQIAKELGVDHVLEGSVQRQGDEVRITTQLIRADQDTQLWSQTYDRKLKDIFGVESEVARAVADALQATLTGTERRALEQADAPNQEAYDQYLRGLASDLHSVEPTDLTRAEGFLRRATELAPEFAPAWARLARVDARLAYLGVGSGAGLCDKAAAEADTALKLKPDLAEAYLAQGYYLNLCRQDLDGAQAAFERAQLIQPGSADALEGMASVEHRRGTPEKALDYLQQAIILDPRNAELLDTYAMNLAQMRRFDEARATAERVLDFNQADSSMRALQVFTLQAEGRLDDAQKALAAAASPQQELDALEYQVLQRLYQRQYPEAIAQLQQALRQDLDAVGLGGGDYYYLLGVAQMAAGDAAAAHRTFDEGQAYLARFADEVRATDNALYLHAMLCLMQSGQGAAAASEDCRVLETAAAADTPQGLSAAESLARARALQGRPDAVAAGLPKLLKASYYSYLYSAPLTPALLRQDPVWDRMRRDPRFQALAGG